MFHFEEENRANIVSNFDIHLRNCQSMLDFANHAVNALIQRRAESGLHSQTLTVLISMIVRETRKLRAVAVLCERGFVGEGQQLVRSLFEGALAARFVCQEPVPDVNRPADIRPHNYPEIPPDKNRIDFRARVYAAHMLMQKHRNSEEPEIVALIPAEILASISNSAIHVSTEIGPEWTKRLGKTQGYAGMRVQDLSWHYGLISLYPLYKELSNENHANNAFACVQWESDRDVTVLWCGKDEKSIPETLKFGVTFLADTCHAILLANGLSHLAENAYFIAQATTQIQ